MKTTQVPLLGNSPVGHKDPDAQKHTPHNRRQQDREENALAPYNYHHGPSPSSVCGRQGLKTSDT